MRNVVHYSNRITLLSSHPELADTLLHRSKNNNRLYPQKVESTFCLSFKRTRQFSHSLQNTRCLISTLKKGGEKFHFKFQKGTRIASSHPGLVNKNGLVRKNITSLVYQKVVDTIWYVQKERPHPRPPSHFLPQNNINCNGLLFFTSIFPCFPCSMRPCAGFPL